MSAGEVASRFDVTQPAISQHLKVLKDTGLVKERREGTRRWYSVRSEGLSDVQAFLAEVLPASLERLKLAAEEEERSRDARHVSRN
jgi:DNA-binding transcriptional ArsR family regulator